MSKDILEKAKNRSQKSQKPWYMVSTKNYQIPFWVLPIAPIVIGVSKFSDTELAQSCYEPSNPDTCIQMVKKYFNIVAIKTEKREYYYNVIQRNYEYNKDGILYILGYHRDKRKRYPHPFGGYDNKPICVLADGSEFLFSFYANPAPGYDGASFTIDTNGEKGPNVVGFDIFHLYLEASANGSKLSGDDYFQEIQKNNLKFPW